jgi:2,3-bisphosphoglycerate-independent phosphoglycerate mutase
MEASRRTVGASPLAATQIWLWGQGGQPRLPKFADRFGRRAGLVTAVDLVRGLGVLTGIEVIEVDGATGWYDTNYEGKCQAALDALAGDSDVFIIHVEATDEAGHAGDVAEKVRALENWDQRILGPLLDGLDAMGPWRLLLVPDHATPIALKTHTSDPVPYLLVDSEHAAGGGTYSEKGVAEAAIVPGHSLMGRLLGADTG